MSDRTSAEIFGKVFNLLAKDPTEQHKQFARELYAETGGYDFSQYQMYCDDALRTLGIEVED